MSRIPARLDALELADDMAHVARRKKLSLLHVDRLARSGGRNEQVGLTAEKRRNLQDVGDRRRRRRVRRLVNVGQHRQAGARFDLGQRAQPGVETRDRERTPARCDSPCRTMP